MLDKESLIVITGGAGFVGSNLVRHLNEAGYRNIQVVDDLTDSRKFKNLTGLEFGFVDKDDFWKDVLEGVLDADYVFHLGAISSTAHENGKELMEENYSKSVDLISLCVDKKIPIQYASSASVYGNSLGKKEDPLNCYAFSKLCLDNYVRDLIQSYHENSNGKNMYGVYGCRYFNCYDEKTEVLTSSGFKSIKDITLNDFVATLDVEKDLIEFNKPTFLHKTWHKGKMLHFNGKRVDILCTPEQNLFISKGNKSKNYNLIKAEQVVGQNLFGACLKQTAGWVGKNKNVETIPSCLMEDGRQRDEHREKKIPIKIWLAFLGWFLSEGSVYSSVNKKNGARYFRVNISQMKNPAFIEEIYDLCKKMGFKPQRTFKKAGKIATGVTIHSKQLYLHLEKFSKEKFIPREILELKSAHLNCLMQTLIKGDGDSDGSRYTTKYKNFADQFQELLLKIGKVGRVSKDGPVYRVHISKNDHPQLGNNECRSVTYSDIDWDDFVYDITVKNHVFLSRRNGIICWTGNCYGPGEAHKDGQASPVYKFWKQLRNEGKIEVFEKEAKRDFIHVDDVCRFHLNLMNDQFRPAGIFDVGTGTSHSFFQIAKMVDDEMCKLNVPLAKELERMAESIHKISGGYFSMNPRHSLIVEVSFPPSLIGKYQYHTRAPEPANKEGMLTTQQGVAQYVAWLERQAEKELKGEIL